MKMMGRRVAAVPVLALLFCLAASLAAAGELLPAGLVMSRDFQPGLGRPVGRVVLVQGEVVVVHRDEKVGYEAFAEMPLFKSDTIVTRADGRLRFMLNDESIMTLASNTRLTLSESVYEKDRARTTFLKMDVGKARFVVKKLFDVKRTEFKVKTPTALVGVRGSDFVVLASRVLTEVTALRDTLLEVQSVADLREHPTFLSDLQRVYVEFGGVPSDVEEVTDEELEELRREFSVPGEEGQAPPAVVGERPRAGAGDEDGEDTGEPEEEEDDGADGDIIDRERDDGGERGTLVDESVLVDENVLIDPEEPDTPEAEPGVQVGDPDDPARNQEEQAQEQQEQTTEVQQEEAARGTGEMPPFVGPPNLNSP